jgi:hypothetical protein
VREFLASKQITVLEHLLYSLDLAPNDFFSVPKDKGNIERDEIRSIMMAPLKAIPQNQFQNCTEGWTRHWHQCIASQREYFEGDHSDIQQGVCSTFTAMRSRTLLSEFSCQLPVGIQTVYEKTRRLVSNGRQPGTQLVEGCPLTRDLHGCLWQEDLTVGSWWLSLGRNSCQETASGDRNRLRTLVCVCQWSVKCSSEWCIQVVNKSNIQSIPHL